MKIIQYTFFIVIYIFSFSSSFANQSQSQVNALTKSFRSIACDDSGAHCLGLSHDPAKDYSLTLYRTDNAGENWYLLNTSFYTRIGSEKNLDNYAGMKVSCDQFLQNCLIGVTILHGEAKVFYGTNDGAQSWKGTILWNDAAKTLQPSYISQLTCNPSTGSQCHLLTDKSDLYVIDIDESDFEMPGNDTLNLRIKPMHG